MKTLRLDYYHTGTAKSETFAVDRVVVEPAPWAGNPSRPIDETNLGKYFFEVIDRASNRVVYSRGFSSIFGEWETTDEAQSPARTFQESLRFPMPEAPVQVVVKKRDARNAFREVWSTMVDPADQFIDTVHAAIARCRHRAAQERRSGDKGRSPHPGRRLHRRRAAEVREGRAAARRDPVCDLALQGAQVRLQRLGPVSYRRRVRDLAAVHRPPSAVADWRHLRRLRIRALRPDLRQPRVSRRRLVRALRRRRDPRERPDVRRRRHLRPLRDRRCRQPVVAVCLRPRVRPPHRGAGRRVLHVRRGLPAGRRSGRAVGAECHRAARRHAPEVEGSRRADTPLPTPWGKQAYETHSQAIQQTRRAIRAANKPESEMDALFLTAAEGGDGHARRREIRAGRRRVRGRELRGEAATTVRRRTASCSRATRCRSAACASARSRA